MKKVIYFTSAMMPEDFQEVVNNSLVTLNPSGQNFHYKLINAFTKFSDVQIVCARPINHKTHYHTRFKTKDNGIFHYLGFKNTRLSRRRTLIKSAKKFLRPIIATTSDLVFVVDALSVLLSELALSIGNKYGIPVYAILTDKPGNLSNVSNMYVKRVEQSFNKYSGFITLTEGLDEYANRSDKPSLILPGIVRAPLKKDKKAVKQYTPYFFFGGALYERYGVKNLIEAFKLLPTKHKLLIAGHGELTTYIKQEALLDERIIYLGLISEDEYDVYVANAAGAINPRPLDKRIDLYSVPSKVLNYFNNATLVFSSDHPLLTRLFPSSYISLGVGSTIEIYDALNAYLLSKDDYLYKRLKGQKDVQKLCQIDEVAAKLKLFFLNKPMNLEG